MIEPPSDRPNLGPTPPDSKEILIQAALGRLAGRTPSPGYGRRRQRRLRCRRSYHADTRGGARDRKPPRPHHSERRVQGIVANLDTGLPDPSSACLQLGGLALNAMRKLTFLRFGPVLLALSALGLPQPTPVWVKLPQPAEIANDPTVPRGADRIGPAGTHRIWVTSSQARRSWLTPDDGRTWEAITYPSGVLVEGVPCLLTTIMPGQWAIRPGGAWLASTSDRGKPGTERQ